MPTSERFLDRMARPHLGAGQRFPAYRTLGTAGAVAGFSLVVLLGWATRRPWSELVVVTATVPLSFLLAVKLSVIAFGRERIVFYEKTLFVLGVTALVLHAAGHPVARGVDLGAIGTGVFLIFGRLGCFMVACCFGRPARWGVRYGEAHARVGFPRWLVGTRLLPLQLVDAAVSAVAVTAAVVAYLRGAPAAAIYLAVYGLGRFVEELFRHDAARPRWLRASEAQWTALLIAWGLVLVVGPTWWTLANAAALSVGFAVVAARPRSLTDAWHTAELARAIADAEGGAAVATSLGIKVSFARIDAPGGPFRDYILSSTRAPLDPTVVRALAGAVGLAHATIQPAATPGLFHVLVKG